MNLDPPKTRPAKTLTDDETQTSHAPVGIDYRAVFEHAADGILVVGTDGVIHDANPEVERQFGYDPGELVGQNVDLLVPSSLRSAHGGHRSSYAREGAPRAMGAGLELHGVRKDGFEFPVEISLNTQSRNGSSLVICIIRDMSERKQLRNLGIAAIQGAERERRRLALELHDDTAQHLSALMLRLRVLTQEQDPEKRAEMVEALREELRAAADGVRRIARGLRPPALEDAGVVTAIMGHAQDFLDESDIRWEVDADSVDHLMSEDQRLVLYRVVQEAISNVVRHSGASTISVRITAEEDSVCVRVIDDGRGFEKDRATIDRGLGLLGMRERALGVGGDLDCETAPGEGTTIVLSLPIQEPEFG